MFFNQQQWKKQFIYTVVRYAAVKFVPTVPRPLLPTAAMSRWS